MERKLTSRCEQAENVYHRNVYQIRRSLLDKLNFFGLNYKSEQKLFKKSTVFDFESICVQKETFKDTLTTTWIGKHIPSSVSNSSKLLEEATFLCNSDPHHPVPSFIGTLEKLADQSKAKMKNLVRDIESTLKVKLGSVLQKLTQCHNRRGQDSLNDCENGSCAFSQFVQIYKNQLIVLQELLERFCSVLSVFGFNGSKYDINWKNHNCYRNFLTNCTLKLLLSKQRISSSRSGSVISGC